MDLEEQGQRAEQALLDQNEQQVRRSPLRKAVAISASVVVLIAAVVCVGYYVVSIKSQEGVEVSPASTSSRFHGEIFVMDASAVGLRNGRGNRNNNNNNNNGTGSGGDNDDHENDSSSSDGGKNNNSNSNSSGSNSSNSGNKRRPTRRPNGGRGGGGRRGNSTKAALHLAPAGTRRDSCYIVKMQRGVGASNTTNIRRQLARGHRTSEERDFSFGMDGFSLCGVNSDLLAQIQDHPDVDFVEEDAVVSMSIEWGVDRIDQQRLPLDNVFNSNGITGAGVDVYVVDTGVRSTHSEFGGRVLGGTSFVGGDYQDCNGHGTHVAGTIGGATVGVAPAVSLFAVRVLDCTGSGTTSGVISGLNWVGQNVRAGRKSVVNMSLGGSASSSLDSAVRSLVAADIAVVVAAGNDGADACNSSPSRVSEAVTVGAVSSSDVLASWSNYGSCVDILSPGVNIRSAWYSSDTSYNTISGTSMATPHVVGAAALYFAARPTASAAQLASDMVSGAVLSVISGVPAGTANRMLYITPLVSSGGGATAATTAAAAPATTTARPTTTTVRPTTTTARPTTTTARPTTTTARPTTTTARPSTTTARASTTAAAAGTSTSRPATTTRTTTAPPPPPTTSSSSSTSRPAATTTAGSVVCSGNLCETGSLSGTGVSNYHPGVDGYYCTTSTGTVSHSAKLQAVSTSRRADFDLYLWKWDDVSARWYTVDSSTSTSTSEQIIFTSQGGGCWSWEVYSYTGSGSYRLDMSIPA